MSNVVEVLKQYEGRVPIILRTLRVQYGFPVEYYYPSVQLTAYGPDDSLIQYQAKPSFTEIEVITGIYSPRYASDKTLDSFTGEDVKIYTLADSPVKKDSKVVVKTGTRVYNFRINGIRVLPGINSDLCKILELVPLQ